MTILDAALSIQILMRGQGLNDIKNGESRRVFWRLCAFVAILATTVGALEIATPKSRLVADHEMLRLISAAVPIPASASSGRHSW
ncbi:hypothetical protein [Sinorhizobium alkalisoli]|uniref:hypothetical protein n=1 Tax=Sinorhizobium alkalisoli TaxID=1752398 RepID=UPI001041FCF5|nr:hypothetical protein [Sinorhizobium alkalisoli]